MEDLGYSKCVCADKSGYLLGIGNPLLDISAIVDEELLEKYDLKPNDAIMAEEKHMPLYSELMEKYKTEFLAGGSVQNSLRVAQWIIKTPHVCTYFGCVGEDDYARILKERAIADGVMVQYQSTAEAPTGTCAVLVTGTQRSLCANLAAAQRFTHDHLDSPESQRLIDKANIIYVSGFFIAVSPPSIMRLASLALQRSLTFALNLSAPFVSQFYKEPLAELLPYVDILFGNETEAEAFVRAFALPAADAQAAALQLAAFPKHNPRPRVVVITQGCEPVILVENGQVTLVPVTRLSRDEIVDTNGAGDAFAGGFLGQLVLGRSLRTCAQCAVYAATHVIRHCGCSFSGDSDFRVS